MTPAIDRPGTLKTLQATESNHRMGSTATSARPPVSPSRYWTALAATVSTSVTACAAALPPAKTVEICIPQPVLPAATPPKTPEELTKKEVETNWWNILKVTTVHPATVNPDDLSSTGKVVEWTKTTVRVNDDPGDDWPITSYETNPVDVPGFCGNLEEDVSYTITVRARSAAIGTQKQDKPQQPTYEFVGTLELAKVDFSDPAGRATDRVNLFLGDRSLPPFCNWKGRAELKRNGSTLAELTLLPVTRPLEGTAPCMQVMPKLPSK